VVVGRGVTARSLGHDYLPKAMLGTSERLLCAQLMRVVRLVTHPPNGTLLRRPDSWCKRSSVVSLKRLNNKATRVIPAKAGIQKVRTVDSVSSTE
jgi:hypothetical protein